MDTEVRRCSRVRMLSLAAFALGIGLICWSLINISTPITYEQAKPVSPDAGSYAAADVMAGDDIGSLWIPVLEQKLPIVQGTGSDELKNGVGHYIQSVMPGENDNCVLSGHRDTVFSKLGKLKIGDQLIVETATGAFTYEVNGSRIVDKDDRTVIVPSDHAMLTLSTCYPFYFVGSAPERYIITADLVKGE